jgi:hypothetical protein
VDPTRPRGWGSHRLHRDDGPAIVWPDGWGVWSWHGTRVPQRVIERPETLTAHEVNTEENAEVRRAMLERMGMERFVREAGAIIVNTDEWGTLYSIPPANDDEPLMVVKVTNSTPEPDGTFKDYLIPVDPNAYGGLLTARAAIASTWRIKRDGERPENWELAFKTPEEYQPAVQT